MFLAFFPPLYSLSLSLTVHVASADGHSCAGTAREVWLAIWHATNAAQAHCSHHQHAAAGHHQSAGHSVAVASIHQVIP